VRFEVFLMLEKAAKHMGTSKGEVLRNCFLFLATGYPQYFGEERGLLWELKYEFIKQGRNLNQIAKKINNGEFVASQEILDAVQQQKERCEKVEWYLRKRYVNSWEQSARWREKNNIGELGK